MRKLSRFANIISLSRILMHLEIRNGIAMFFNFFFPLLLLSIFKNFSIPVSWTTIGTLCMGYVSSVIMVLPINLSTQRDNKILIALKLSPLYISDYIIAVSVHTMHLMILQTILILGVSATFFGADLHFSFINLPALIVVLLPSFITLYTIGFIISALGKTMKMTNIIGSIFNMVFLFLPPLFFPSNVWNGSLIKYFVEIIPITHIVTILREVLVDGQVNNDTVYHALYYMIPMAIITFFIAVKTFSYQGNIRFRGKVYSVN